jgi:hypothetical protein
MVGRVLPCFFFFGNFCMDKCSVDSDEAMKRGDEALNASLLQFLSIVKRASSLRFLLSVKRFIAVNFFRKRSLNASSPLLFKRNSSLNASSPLLFKLTLPTSAFHMCLERYRVGMGAVSQAILQPVSLLFNQIFLLQSSVSKETEICLKLSQEPRKCLEVKNACLKLLLCYFLDLFLSSG